MRLILQRMRVSAPPGNGANALLCRDAAWQPPQPRIRQERAFPVSMNGLTASMNGVRRRQGGGWIGNGAFRF
eukprot:364810-Chlamydomonas_euryale.AAC.2